MENNFIHLRVHSAYSLSEGAIKVPELVNLAKENNMPAVGISDSGNLFGSLEFAMATSKAGIQPIIGVVTNLTESDDGKLEDGKLVLIAKNDIGYANLLKIISASYIEGEDCHHPIVSLTDLRGLTEGLIALSGGADGLIGKYILNNNQSAAENLLLKLNELFKDHLYIELQRHGLSAEIDCEKGLIDLAYKHNLPLVATNDAYFATRDMHEAHDSLICIASGNYVSETNRKRYTAEHYFKSQSEMKELFSDIPEAIINTEQIANRCSVMSEPHAPMLPHFDTDEGRSEDDELRKVAEDGLEMRLRTQVFTAEMSEEEKEKIRKTYFERLEYELDVIIGMEFPGYFLIVSDFIRWSKENNIPVGPGRGSGAGSVVAWVMEITNLDPLRFGLLFERFLNPERVSMPDFDIDFCQEKRDRVILYVQEKYGKDRVAQIITFGKLQARAVLRDVGRVLQMSYGQVDRICKMIPFNALEPVTLSQAIEMDPDLRHEQKTDQQVAHLIDIGLKLEGLYRHASTHAAGVVIGSKPLDEIVPLYTDHKTPMPTTQYSMKYAETAGLVKFDFLGLKTLTTIAKACELVQASGIEIDIETIPFDDKKTFEMLSSGNTTGVFQMESAGMRDALRKMKADCIEDIIALISLYRPGPMENIPTYIARKHGKEKPDYLHPKLEEVLKETFGVIIYQEQVMKIPQILAGYTLGGADILRRAMGKKIKAEMDKQRQIFEEGAVKNGVDKDHASSIFDLVAKFAGYGFNKSHAAAYAVIGYQTAYLKANHPVEFLTASMNIDIGDTDKLNVYRDDALLENIVVLPPNINKSQAYFSVEEFEGKNAIRYGLGGLKNVGLDMMLELEQMRNSSEPFADMTDFANRCDSKIINKRQLESLAKSGAFDCFDENRKRFFDGATMITKYNQAAQEEKNSNQISLFGGGEDTIPPPLLLPTTDDWAVQERLAQEFDAIGFYLQGHPIDAYDFFLKTSAVIRSNALAENISTSGNKIKVAGVVQRTVHRSSGAKRFAYVYLSDPAGTMEISLFNERLINESREMLESGRPLVITLDARKDEGGIRLQASSICYLDDEVAQKRYNLHIQLKNSNSIDQLKKVVAQSFESKTSARALVNFIVKTENNMEVEIQLNETIPFDNILIENFSKIPDVEQVFAN